MGKERVIGGMKEMRKAGQGGRKVTGKSKRSKGKSIGDEEMEGEGGEKRWKC